MKIGPWFRPFGILGCILLMGCGTWEEERVEELRVLTRTKRTNNLGTTRIKVPLTAADDAMLLQVQPQRGFFAVILELEDAEGNVIYDFEEDVQRSRQITSAAVPSTLGMLNWPIRADDPALEGEEITARFAAVDDQGTRNANVRMDVSALLKSDKDWESGEVYINLIFAGSVAGDTAIEEAVNTAMDKATLMYEEHGILFSVESKTWNEGNLPKPGSGAPGQFELLSSASRMRTVNVVVVPSILESESLLGASGSIPGPLMESDRSAVLISAAANAGPDMIFDELETRLLSETIGHELGHYFGLFHPVESTWDKWDGLRDTEDCTDQQVCEDSLGTNLMFPYPVCDGDMCELQDTLSEEQQSVLHRYTGVW